MDHRWHGLSEKVIKGFCHILDGDVRTRWQSMCGAKIDPSGPSRVNSCTAQCGDYHIAAL